MVLSWLSLISRSRRDRIFVEKAVPPLVNNRIRIWARRAAQTTCIAVQKTKWFERLFSPIKCGISFCYKCVISPRSKRMPDLKLEKVVPDFPYFPSYTLYSWLCHTLRTTPHFSPAPAFFLIFSKIIWINTSKSATFAFAFE